MTDVAASIIDRKTARAAGLKFFSTGRPCREGHYCERYVTSGGCTFCYRERGALWRANNPGYFVTRVIVNGRAAAAAAKRTARDALIFDAIDRGLSYAAIGRQMGITRQSVSRIAARRRAISS